MNYSNADKELLINNQAVVYSKILLYDEEGNLLHTFTEDDFLVDWEYEDFRYVPNEGFVGQFVERLLDGNLKNIPDNISLENKEIELQVGISNITGGDITYYSYGRFIITSIGKTDTSGNYKFESSDYTKKFNVTFDGNSIKYPCTAMQLLDAAATQANVFVKDDDKICCIHAVSDEDDITETGQYCIKYNDKYYKFSTYLNLKKNDCIIYMPDENKVHIKYIQEDDNVFRYKVPCVEESVTTATELSSVTTTYYNFTNNDFVIDSNQFEENSSCRDVIKAIAKLSYTWARVDENNELVLDIFHNTSTQNISEYNVIDTDKYYEAKVTGDTVKPINKISIGMSNVEGENITIGETECKYTLNELSGDTYQEITNVRGDNTIVFSGKNKLNTQFESKSAIGVDADYSDSYIELDGTANTSANYDLRVNSKDRLQPGTYTLIFEYLSGSQTNGAIRISVGDSEMTPATNNEHRYFSFVSQANNESNIVDTKTFTIDKEINKVSLYINNTVSFDEYRFRLYLVEGTYTASEIPEYEVHYTKEYPINLPVENLFDKDTMVLNAYISYSNGDLADSDIFRTVYLKCKPNTTYTFSQSVSSNRHILGFTSDNNINTPKTLTDLVDMNNTFDKKYTFTTNANTKYVFMMVSKTDVETSNVDDILNSIQIEEGNVANTFTPYGVEPIELAKLNDYTYDSIGQENGKWYISKYNSATEEITYKPLLDQLNAIKNISFPYDEFTIESFGKNNINPSLMMNITYPYLEKDYGTGSRIDITDNVHLEESMIRIDDNPLTYTEQLRRIAINGGYNQTFGTEGLADLMGITYTPITVQSIGHPWLLGGDLVKVENLSEEELYFYPFDRKISYKGYIETELSSQAQNEVSQKYQNNNNVVDRMSHTEIVVDKANKKIESIAQEVTETTDKMSKVTQDINGVSTQIENINKTVDDNTKEIAAIQETIDGLSVEKSVTGGNNLIKNSVGYFGNDFWMIDDSNEGNIKTLNNIDVKNNSISACALLLQDETVYQKITEIKNGSYYISFRYKKLLNLATCKLVINGEEFELTSDSWQDEGKELAVTSNNIQISLISDMDDSCLITDLIVSNGTKKVSWTQNANETYTDGVKIGKGITITATGSDTELSATASSIDIINTRNRESTSTFDKYGIKTNSLESKGTVRIADKLIISKVGDQMWISTL